MNYVSLEVAGVSSFPGIMATHGYGSVTSTAWLCLALLVVVGQQMRVLKESLAYSQGDPSVFHSDDWVEAVKLFAPSICIMSLWLLMCIVNPDLVSGNVSLAVRP